jgi:hypothetical protein
MRTGLLSTRMEKIYLFLYIYIFILFFLCIRADRISVREDLIKRPHGRGPLPYQWALLWRRRIWICADAARVHSCGPRVRKGRTWGPHGLGLCPRGRAWIHTEGARIRADALGSALTGSASARTHLDSRGRGLRLRGCAWVHVVGARVRTNRPRIHVDLLRSAWMRPASAPASPTSVQVALGSA